MTLLTEGTSEFSPRSLMNLHRLPNAASIDQELSPLYFLHIPKTAGTTFNQFLEAHFDGHDVCPAHLWRALLTIPAEEISRRRLIWGHFYSFLYKHFSDPVRYVVFLRDPVERALSHYGHILKFSQHYFHRRALKLGSFSAFLRDPETSTTAANFQVRALALDLDPKTFAAPLTAQQLASGELERRLEAAPFDRPVPEMLEIAKRRLEQMCFVGITERYEESIELFCRRFRWERPEAMTPLNVNEGRIQREDLSSTDLLLLREMNGADVELYEFANELFLKNFSKDE